jgi:uncharacterized protein YkwD
MGVYNPRPAQVGQTQVNAVNGFAPAPAMPQNGFAQQGPMPQPNPMRQTVPQPGVPQGPMPAQQQPNPMLGGAGMQQPGQPSMVDRLMSPMGQIGLSMMAQGPSLTPVNPMAGIGTALGNSITYQRQKNVDAQAAQERQAKEQEKLANQERLNRVASYYAQRFGDDEAQVRDLFAAGMGEAYIESRTGGGADLSAAEEKIQRIMSTHNVDQRTAVGIVDGTLKLQQDPLTGDRVVVDMTTNRATPVDVDYKPSERGELGSDLGSGETLYEQADDATGVVPTVGRAISNTVGQTGIDMFQAPDQTQAASEFDLFKRDLIRSMSLNPRFPVAEQQRIENLIPVGPMTSAASLRTSLEALDRELARIEQDTSIGARDRTSPVQTRQQDAQTLRAVRLARERLGVMRKNEPQRKIQPTETTVTDEERAIMEQYGVN